MELNERVFGPGWPSALLATNRKERNEVKLELTWKLASSEPF